MVDFMLKFNKNECVGVDECNYCVDVCSTGALHYKGIILVWDTQKCTKCESCTDVCTVGALTAEWGDLE